MNLAKFNSAKKQHLQLRSTGAFTVCNKRSSGMGVHEIKSFAWNAEKYPETCCKKCLARYMEIKSRNEKK